MPRVKPVGQSAEKWARNAGNASSDYQAGVRSPGKSWAQATAEAEESWKQGIQDAAARNAFSSGVNAAGDEKWRRKTAGVGVQRFASGVRAAQADYQAGFAPYAQVIEGVTLPPRGPKGSPQNYQRVQAIGEALHNAKTGGAGV